VRRHVRVAAVHLTQIGGWSLGCAPPSG
jgi:hypothetical protein